MDPSERKQLVSDVQHNKPYGGQGDGSFAGDQNHKPALVKRIKQRLTGGEPDVAAYKGETPSAPHVDVHDHSQDYAIAVGHAVLAQALLELSEPRNIAVLSTLTREMVGQIGRQLNEEPGQRGTRQVLNEVVVGGCDAIERKAKEVLRRLPAPVFLAGAGAAAFAGLMLLGVFLSIWRFALFGV